LGLSYLHFFYIWGCCCSSLPKGNIFFLWGFCCSSLPRGNWFHRFLYYKSPVYIVHLLWRATNRYCISHTTSTGIEKFVSLESLEWACSPASLQVLDFYIPCSFRWCIFNFLIWVYSIKKLTSYGALSTGLISLRLI
jgi:hypothetical protein